MAAHPSTTHGLSEKRKRVEIEPAEGGFIVRMSESDDKGFKERTAIARRDKEMSLMVGEFLGGSSHNTGHVGKKKRKSKKG